MVGQTFFSQSSSPDFLTSFLFFGSFLLKEFARLTVCKFYGVLLKLSLLLLYGKNFYKFRLGLSETFGGLLESRAGFTLSLVAKFIFGLG